MRILEQFTLRRIALRLPKGVRLTIAGVLTFILIIYCIFSFVEYAPQSSKDEVKMRTYKAFHLNRYDEDYMVCLDKAGFGTPTLVYENETNEKMIALFMRDSNTIYEIAFNKRIKNNVTEYCINDYYIDDNHNRLFYYSNIFAKNNIEYIYSSVGKYIGDRDFEGYIPEIKAVNMKDNGQDVIYRFYIIDKSKAPHSSYNYAPICGLLKDENDVNKAIEICDTVMSMDRNTDVNELVNMIGAQSVKQLPATIEYTYDYQMNNGFNLRSHGMPYDEFILSTEYGNVVFDLNDKTVTEHY